MLELLGSVSAEMIANFLPEGPLATPEHLHVAAWNKASDKLFGHILLVVRKAVEGMGIKPGLEMILKVQQNVLWAERNQTKWAHVLVSSQDAANVPLERKLNWLATIWLQEEFHHVLTPGLIVEQVDDHQPLLSYSPSLKLLYQGALWDTHILNFSLVANLILSSIFVEHLNLVRRWLVTQNGLWGLAVLGFLRNGFDHSILGSSLLQILFWRIWSRLSLDSISGSLADQFALILVNFECLMSNSGDFLSLPLLSLRVNDVELMLGDLRQILCCRNGGLDRALLLHNQLKLSFSFLQLHHLVRKGWQLTKRWSHNSDLFSVVRLLMSIVGVFFVWH